MTSNGGLWLRLSEDVCARAQHEPTLWSLRRVEERIRKRLRLLKAREATAEGYFQLAAQ